METGFSLFENIRICAGGVYKAVPEPFNDRDQGSAGGPVHTKWDVTDRPAIYVLDARGVIRYKDLKGDELDKAVDTLLAKHPTSK